jgi:1,4-alpha-glucan branching enzyme
LLLGEFSQWQPIELKRMKNGEFKATLNLPTDGPSHFEYCYQLVQPDGETLYDNDWEADDYVPGPFGRDNSVVRVSQPG